MGLKMSSISAPLQVKATDWTPVGTNMTSIVVDGGLSVPHGLGEKPDFVLARMVALVASYGYAIGDVIDLSSSVLFGLNTSYGFNFAIKDDININVCGASLYVLGTRRDLTTAVSLGGANWQLQFKAVKFI